MQHYDSTPVSGAAPAKSSEPQARLLPDYVLQEGAVVKRYADIQARPPWHYLKQA